VSRGQCGILNILQSYGPPRPVTGIALLLHDFSTILKIIKVQRTLSSGTLMLDDGVMSSAALYCVALFQTDVLENVQSPSSGVLMLIGFHSCITVETLLLSLSTEGHY
jgi:hypothetical protein